jgi:hypothetical protein
VNLFEFANERESIRLLREAGVSAPWTKDERLQRLHFGNIFREDDPTTRFIHQRLFLNVSEDDALLFACVGRMFGTVEALDFILDEWDVDDMFEILEPRYPRWWRFTGRYRIKVPAGSTQMETVKGSLRLVKLLEPMCWSSEESAHKLLCMLPAVGPMCANEIIADLRGTSVFPFGHGEEYVFPHWGVMAGLGLKPKKLFPLAHNHPKVLEAQSALRDILEQSRTEWRYPDRPWTLTTAARAALLYGQYLNEDYPRKRRITS